MTDVATRDERRIGSPVAWYLAIGTLLVVVAAVLPLVIAQRAGVLSLPRSDDWSYLKTLFAWDRGGQLDFNHWVSMTLIGQLALALPVVKVWGASVTAVRVAVAVLGAIALLLVLVLGRQLGLPRGPTALVAFSVALGPMWGPLAATFMTEVPTLALHALTLVLAARALRGRAVSSGWLAAAIVAAFWAAAIRQYSLVLGGAVLLVAWLVARGRGDARAARHVIVIGVVFAVACVVLLAWWQGVPDRLELSPKVPGGTALKYTITGLVGYVRATALLLLPVVLYARPVAVVRRAWRLDRRLAMVVGGGTIGLMLLASRFSVKSPFVGNYLDEHGALGNDIIDGNRPGVMPHALFVVIVFIASAAAVVLMLMLVPALVALRDRWRTRRFDVADPALALVAIAVTAFALVYELAILVELPLFDRYVLPVLPFVGLLVVRGAPSGEVRRALGPVAPRGVWVAGVAVALALLAGLGIVYAQESASFDAARWQAARAAVSRGYAATDIDAGYEWAGWVRGIAPPYKPAVPDHDELLRLRARYRAGTCLTITVNPPTVPDHVVAVVRSDGLLRRPTTLYARTNGRPCAVPPLSR
jgi:hypothetical protein